MNAKPISEGSGFNLELLNRAQGCSKYAGSMIGIVFMLAAIAISIVMIFMAQAWYSARSWPSTTCKILTSEIKIHDGDESDTFSPEFTFELEVDGNQHIGRKFIPFEFSSGRKRAEKAIADYPIGSEQTCFYNPANPSDAVLNRDLSWFMLLPFFFPIVFFTIGCWTLISSLRAKPAKGPLSRTSKSTSGMSGIDSNALAAATLTGKSNSSKPGSEIVFPADEEDAAWDKPMQLKPSETRWSTVLVLGFFALFWNGIVSVFVYQLIFDPPGGFATWGLGLFLIPFVLIGLGIFGFMFYTFLQLFNPKVEIAISNGAVPLGGDVDLAWEVTGRISSIRNLKITIKARELATYRRGTDTITDDQTVALIPVAEATTLDEIQFGSAVIQIPADAMHTCDFGNNKIEWAIEVKGDIPWWPDISENYPFRVRPS